MKAIFPLITLFTLLTVAGKKSQKPILKSGVKKTTLVELYTSEGCSSCPRADRWMNQFAKDKQLFKTFIPVSFHVDYWDYLGWEDDFAEPLFTKRQRSYARKWKSSTVYTPGVVVDGNEKKSWSGMRSIPQSSKKVGQLEIFATPRSDTFKVKFRATDASNYQIYGARLLSGVRRQIRSGENSGRTLVYDFAACPFSVKKLSKSKKSYVGEIRLDNCKKTLKPKKSGLVFWVSQSGDPSPVQSVAGWTP